MKIERKIPEAIKRYFVEIKSNVENKSYNLHIYDDKSRNKRNYVFVISKDLEKKDKLDKNNIVSIINIENQNDVVLLVNKLGKAISDVKNLDRASYDHDLIESINKHTTNINKDIWISKSANKYVSPKEALKIKEYSQIKRTAVKNLSGDDMKLKAIKPIVLIDTLINLGIISLKSTEPNGNDELKHKFIFSDTLKHGDKKFNISVAKYGTLSGSKGDLFKDFSNDKNKELGVGSIGLIAHLGECGLFNFGDISSQEKKNHAKDFLLKEVLKHIPEDQFVAPNTEVNRVYFDSKALTFQPIIKNTDYVVKKMTDFLEYRGLRKTTVQSLVERGSIISGDFYNSKLVKEIDHKGVEKFNYGYNNVPFFRLRDGFNNQYFGAERFQISKVNNNDKPYTYDKQNIGKLDGRYWSEGEQIKPDMAIIHEAIIDGASSMELLDYAGLDPEKVRYFSTQGATHFKKFMTKNVGFWSSIDKSGKEDTIKSSVIYHNKKEIDINDSILKEYNDKFKNREIIFFDYGDSPNSLKYKINAIKPILGVDIKIIKIKRADINFSNYDQKTSIILDKENFNDFLDNIRLKISFDEAKKKNIVKTLYIKDNEIPYTEAKKSSIINKIKRFFGTTNLVFCFDNDPAGLKNLPVFTEMKRHLGIDIRYMIPNDDVKPNAYKQFSGLRMADMFIQYEKLCGEDKYQDAYKLLNKYSKQEPDIDNNDVLKKYLDLAKNEPAQAEKLLQSKLDQLNIPKNSPLLKKKANIRRKP